MLPLFAMSVRITRNPARAGLHLSGSAARKAESRKSFLEEGRYANPQARRLRTDARKGPRRRDLVSAISRLSRQGLSPRARAPVGQQRRSGGRMLDADGRATSLMPRKMRAVDKSGARDLDLRSQKVPRQVADQPHFGSGLNSTRRSSASLRSSLPVPIIIWLDAAPLAIKWPFSCGASCSNWPFT